MQSILHPVSSQAHVVRVLWWWMFGTATVIYVLVVGAMLTAVVRALRAPRRQTNDGLRAAQVSSDRSAARWVAGAGFLTTCAVGGLLVYNIGIGVALGRHPARAMTIEVIGHQWWWEVAYDDPDPRHRFATANEIHIPVGQPVAVALRSTDVIHSFWVPSLGGKRDLIPGYPARAWIQADTPGVYRGQCAEFCGRQHAHMALFVVAEPREQFETWLRGQRVSAALPSDSLRAQGFRVFVAARCGTCHTISGALTLASFGPDLTHLASRATIAGGTLTNTPGHLADWILDPQAFKPGATMPPNPLRAADLEALIAYLGGLK